MTQAQRSTQLQGWLFIGPALLFVAVFVLFPLGQVVYTSLTDRSLLGGGRFVGFANYLRIWRDAGFWRALAFTAKALGIGYVPWVFHFADMVNSDSSPWINMFQRAIFDGDVAGAITEARQKMKEIAAQ